MVKDLKVAWFEAEKWHREYVDTSHDIDFYEKPIQDVEGLEDYDVVSVFVDSELDEDFLRQMGPEKVLCRSTGYDNIDTEVARELGIEVYNVPDYGSETVAEYTIALMLETAKRLEKDLGKNPNTEEGTRGLELKDKTLGVVGAGKIGREVLKRAKAFDMKLLAYDPYPIEEKAEEIGYEYVELEELLRNSEFITVNCPLVESTHHLISDEEFELMENVVFVNTARGPVVDTEALKQGLSDGSVRYAAVDVIEDGEYENLSEMENVSFTPHNAFNTEEANRRIIDITLENLEGKRGPLDLSE